DHVGLPRSTVYSLVEREEVLADLAATRRRGYSVDRQEAVAGVCCVGAPVHDYTGRSVGAISLSTICEFFEPEKTGPAVAEAAVEISRAMGWTGDASGLYAPV